MRSLISKLLLPSLPRNLRTFRTNLFASSSFSATFNIPKNPLASSSTKIKVVPNLEIRSKLIP
jgi:hypothetical protein